MLLLVVYIIYIYSSNAVSIKLVGRSVRPIARKRCFVWKQKLKNSTTAYNLMMTAAPPTTTIQ